MAFQLNLKSVIGILFQIEQKPAADRMEELLTTSQLFCFGRKETELKGGEDNNESKIIVY